MGRFSYLQIIILGVSVLAIVTAIVIFSFGGKKDSIEDISVEIWGTLPKDKFTAYINELIFNKIEFGKIEYREIPESDFEKVYVEALAEGSGPDIIILNNENILKNSNRIITIPFEYISYRDYKDKYIEQGEQFVNATGVYAIPILVDPMVMYWNRTIFNNEGISTPPAYWDTLMEITPRLSKFDSNLRITQSAVAMGEFDNIKNAYEILSTLLMQAGNDVVVRETVENSAGIGDGYRSVLENSYGSSVSPGVAAVNFYTQFADPTSGKYSWNRSLPNSIDYFTSGKLAIYFGFSSEIKLVQSKNSDLNFDIATMPQAREQGDNIERLVYGKIYGLAIARSAENTETAFKVISALTGQQSAQILSRNFELPPAQRELLFEDPKYPTQNIVVRSALMTKSFHTHDINQIKLIFEDLVESVTTGRLTVGQAISRASNEISNLIK